MMCSYAPPLRRSAIKFVEKRPMVIYGNFYDKKVSMDEGFKNFIFSDIPTIGYLSSEKLVHSWVSWAQSTWLKAREPRCNMGIFLETKGDMMGSISTGSVPWDIEAEQAMVKVGEMIPHFVRATALKKLHSVAEQFAKERGTNVTLAIFREVSDKFTRPSSRQSSPVCLTTAQPLPRQPIEDEEVPVSSLTFHHAVGR